MSDPHRSDNSKTTPPTTVVKTDVGGISDLTAGSAPDSTGNLPTPHSLLLPELADDEADCSDIFPVHRTFSSSPPKGNDFNSMRYEKNEDFRTSLTSKNKASIDSQNGVSILRNEKFMSDDTSERRLESNKYHQGHSKTAMQNNYKDRKRNHYTMEEGSSKRYYSQFEGESRYEEDMKRKRLPTDRDYDMGPRYHQAPEFRDRREYDMRNSHQSKNHRARGNESIHRASGNVQKGMPQDTKENMKSTPRKIDNSIPVAIDQSHQRTEHVSPESPNFSPPIAKVPSERTLNSIGSQNILLFENSFGDSIGGPELSNFPLDSNTFNTFNGETGSLNCTASFDAGRVSSSGNRCTNERRENMKPVSNNSKSSTNTKRNEIISSQDSTSISIMMLGGSSSNSLSPRGEITSGLIMKDSPTNSTHGYIDETPNRNSRVGHSSRYQNHVSKGDITTNSKYSSDRDRRSRQVHRPHPKAVSPHKNSPRKNTIPQFYCRLRRHRKAFSKFTFLLPGMKMSSSEFNAIRSMDSSILDLESPKDTSHRIPETKDDPKAVFMPERKSTAVCVIQNELSPADIMTARNRLTSAVCLFGGTTQKKSRSSRRGSNVSSIFRRHNELGIDPHHRFKSPEQIEYERKLPLRYYENDNRLSWEVEEHPPIETVTDDEDNDFNNFDPRHRVKLSKRGRSVTADFNIQPSQSQVMSGHGNRRGLSYMGLDKASFGVDSPLPSNAMVIVTNCGEAPKMKYRCKLCGQPKQNHTCPYEQSLQRSIGTMAFGSLNAYNADEPGSLSAPLSDMNNFLVQEDNGLQSKQSTKVAADNTPDSVPSTSDIKLDDSPHKVPPHSRVTASTVSISSTSEVLSTTSGSSQGRKIDDDDHRITHLKKDKYFLVKLAEGRRRTAAFSKQKPPSSVDTSQDLLVQKKMDIRPEQFRTITPTNNSRSSSSFEYPALPLTYGQRKRLSDSLFTLSKEVNGLTDECADILREARETDMWDVAIAELLTQVLVIIHCPEGDNKLDGLSQYLLTFGVSC